MVSRKVDQSALIFEIGSMAPKMQKTKKSLSDYIDAKQRVSVMTLKSAGIVALRNLQVP